MIKNILTVGDSFTYGEELENRDTAYPYYLAKGLKANVVNLGVPSGGNKQMIRKVMDYVIGGEPLDLVIIGWTSPGRIEFADANGIFDIWPGYGGDLFRRDGQEWRLELLEYINKHHDPEYLYRQFLLDVILLQDFLKQRDIKYIMLRVVGNEYYHNTYHNDDAARSNYLRATMINILF